MQLRPYQEALVAQIRFQYQLGHSSVLAVLPTGGGKTVIFSHIAQSAARKGNRVCILVHRAELLDQASRSLTAMDVPHGCIRANRKMDLTHSVQVASVQTLARRLHLIPPDFFQLLVVDEAHHTNAGTWRNVVEHFNAAKLLGVTATPVRGDGRGLGEWYQAMVLGPSSQQLTEAGFLASAKVLAPPGFDTSGLRKRMGDFDQKQAAQRVNTIMGDCVGHYRKHLPDQTAIAFCCSVAHAEAVADLFKSAGITAASIDGTMSNDCRQDLLQRLGSGSIKVLTSCALIGEGVDVPSVGGCILLRPTESVGLHLQMIGRCLRPQSGKRAVVLDHVGNTLRLGHHLEERQWSLDGIKKRDGNSAPSVKVCPVCFATSPSAAQACEECGSIFPAPERHELKQVDGELVVLHNNQIKSIIIEKDYPGDKDQEFLFGNPVMVKGSYRNNNHTGWKSGILVRLFDPSNKAKLIKSQKLFISRQNALSYGDDKLLCYVLTDEGLITCEPRDLAPTAHKNKAEIAKAQTLDELQKIERKRGYKRGWAERVYQARLAKRHG
jgi:superfamily II DNA or RNA helicase